MSVEISKFLTGFTGPGGFLTGTTTDTGQTITGQAVSPQVSQSISFQESLARFQNILSGGELPETFRQATFSANQLEIGGALNTLSLGLNEQINVRETQRTETNSAIQMLAGSVEEVNARISQQLQQLGQAVSQTAEGGKTNINPFAFLTENPLFAGIGVGGLAVGGIVLLLLLRR